MYDQSFNYITISRMLKKNDFYVRKWLKNPSRKESELKAAVSRASAGFSGYNFLSTTCIRRKNVYRIASFCDELVLRKIDRNLKKVFPLPNDSRDSIIANLKSLLSESIQYKIYRLDIKGFYESFDIPVVMERLDSIKNLSPVTKQFLRDILENFAATGGSGLPRGLSISATLSGIMMEQFDKKVAQLPEVFYYRRYVDDIIIITSGEEGTKQFIRELTELLPKDLHFNRKKEYFCVAPDSKPFKANTQNPGNPILLRFEYLGYRFTVYEPTVKNTRRDVYLDIADSKVNKIKTRLTKAFIDYSANKNFDLLEMRVRLLTSNYAVLDINKGSFRLAGIYHNYHRIDAHESEALKEIDKYLQKAVISGYGKVFQALYSNTTPAQRRRLLTC
jgi:hypothetical protein